MTKRQALLVLLAATPVLAYGQKFEPGGFRVDLPERDSHVVLLQLNLTLPEPRDGKALFLKITVNGKEELAISMDEALRILKE